MFGYITANLQSLSEEQLRRMRACYCGLCRSLQARYGETSRLVLSNDMTFLAMLLSSLYEPGEQDKKRRCLLHPVSPRDYVASPAEDYAADMNLLLAWHKCLDDIQDEGSLRGKAEKALLEKSFREVEARYPEKCRAVAQCLEETYRLEKENSRDIDALCRQSGLMLAECFAWREDAWAPALRRIGYGLGSFIYLMDAWEDYDRDMKRGSFNPLTELHRDSGYEELVRDDLTLLIADATQAFEDLPLEKDIDLLRNILYHGVWCKYDMIRKKKEAKADGRGSVPDPGSDEGRLGG